MGKRSFIVLLLTLFIIVVFILSFFSFYYKGVSFVEQRVDLDGDGMEERIILSSKFLKLLPTSPADWRASLGASKSIWETPKDWQVDNFEVADANNDGKLELNLSVWKRGNFGSSKPFWIRENDPSIKNHFFVFGFEKGKVKPIWQSSNLERPNCEFAFGDIDKDGRQELVVIEGEYGKKCGLPLLKLRPTGGRYLAIWRWNGWGFSNVSRSKEGRYKDLRIINGKILVRSD